MSEETISLKIVAADLASGNISKFVSGLDTMAKKGGLAGSVLQGVGQSFGQMLNPIGLVSTGIGVLGNVLGDSLTAFGEAQVVQAQTEAALKSTGDAAGLTADQIGDLAGAISAYSGQDDEAIQKGENLLLTFTNIKDAAGAGNDIFTQTTKVMADMAQAMGGDAAGQAVLLGKALNDPVRGLTALTRVGVTFTQEQRDQIAAMQRAGNVAGAQKVILGELNKEFGGSAEAFGKTLPGAVAKFDVAMGNLGEMVGGIVAGPLTDLIESLDHIIGGTPDATGAVGEYEAKLREMAAAAEAAAGGADKLTGALPQSGDKTWVGLIAIDEHMDDLFSLLGSSGARVDAWANSMQDLGDQLHLSSDELDHFVDLEMQAHRTSDQARQDLQAIVDAQGDASAASNDMRASLGGATRTFRHFGDEARGAAGDVKHTFARLGPSLESEIQSWKKPIQAAMAEDAWAMKHPFSEEQLANWLGDKMDKAQERLHAAIKRGDTKTVAEIESTIALIQSEIDSLHGKTVNIGVNYGTSGRTYMGGQRGGGRASGGHVEEGVAYTVGEQGWETFVPDRPGTIVPHAASAAVGTTVTVNLAWHSLKLPSPIEAEKIAQELVPAIEGEMRRRGSLARR